MCEESVLLADRELSGPDMIVADCAAARWSDDGHRLIAKLGGSGGSADAGTVAFDLRSREFLVVTGEHDHTGLTWLPEPHPFPGP